MDINSLLSPSESGRTVSSTPHSPQQAPSKYLQRAQSASVSGPLKQGHGASPLSQSVMNQSSIPAHVLSPGPQNISSPLISPVPATNSSQLTRTSSTHSVDTLQDLASMQNQAAKRNRDVYDIPNSPPRINPALAASLTSNPRASFDINMMDGPKQVGRTNFSHTSLAVEQQERLSQLTKHIQDVPSSYEAHVEIIDILHQGLIDHIYPPNESNTRRDPQTYDLLSDLRNARESMEKLFAVGEQLWKDWLQDESMLARTAEERIAIVDSCLKAVNEEVGSVALWTTYGDWVRHCYHWAHESRDSEIDEERLTGREVFTWDLVTTTWQEAVDSTKLNIAHSHTVWNEYLAVQAPNIQQKLSSDQVSKCMSLFEQRLQTPHAAWDDTFQTFSGFVSANFDSEKYEEIMADMLRSASEAKKKLSAREYYEAAIEQAQQAQDRDAEYVAFTQYLQWEQTPEKRKKLDQGLTIALFERAELRFSSDSTLWEEHITFLLGKSKPVLLPVLERATKHCPWSGSLWSQYLLSSDRAGQAFHETEGIKHKATSTGLLEAAGIEEVVKVHGAWCSYLRRRSFRPDGGEEDVDVDVAEMGIRSSIENVASLAAKLGLGEVSDPAFRLHRIYIVFLSESGRWDNARQEFDTSVRDYGKSWEFWLMFYNWEMSRWRRFQNSSDSSFGNVAPPHMATAVLKKALDQPNLDYPEPIMQALMTHCEDFEDAEELQASMLKVQKLRKAVLARRQAEAAQAESAVVAEEPSAQGAKRKREDEVDEESNKKSRSDEMHESVEQPESANLKRNRENATVLVENLPEDVTDTRIRQFFSSCGIVRSLKVLRENDGISAIVEFEDDDAAKYALSRDEQELDGAILSVSLDTGSTLYLTNYKPSADESYIRNLLDKHGEIISIRFPSLQGNKKRRFCYVQFKLPAEAQAASTELDEQKIDDYTLTCKISNPARREARKETHVNDGHTVFVGQLNFKASEAELSKAFSKYGKIETVRMPLHPTFEGRNKGIAYITFESLDEAAKAALTMNGKSFKGRNLTVEVASSRATSTTRRQESVRSITPVQNGKPRDTTSHRDCQVFLTNIPDTVNEAQIREIAGSHGTIVKVILKTNHQGVILQYSDPSEAGQASLKLDGREISSGRNIRVVTESEMLANTREVKVDGFTKDKPKPVAPIGSVAPVRRPQQPGARKGGHLGQRNAALHQTNKDEVNGAGSGKGKKNNDDFRAMLSKSD